MGVVAQTTTSVTRDNVCEKQKLIAYNPISGTIPLAYGHMPATDLVCDSDDCGPGIRKGDILTARQAHEYYIRRHEQTRCQWRLADLEPVVNFESKHIWKGGDVSQHKNVDLDDEEDLALSDMDEVDFVSEAWSRLGNYRVTVNKANFWGVPTQYSIYLSKNAHSFLLRKALLRKLGYIVPPVKRVARLVVKFPSKDLKKKFLSNISVNNAGSFDRWVLSDKSTELVLQDVIVMEDQEFRHNLSKGYLSEDVFQGKRIFDSLVIPFALTETPESINLMDWTMGRIYSDNVALKFPHSKLYNCSHDDAVWMTRRILKLTEKDWRDIVDATQLPPSVKLLLLEKLKSRRNHLGFLMKVQNVNLPVNPHVSNHDDLLNGEITKEFYDGFARRFKIPDPESPLSTSEMKSFFYSKAVSEGLGLATGILNSYLRTDIGSKIGDFKQKLADSVADSMTEGSSSKLPVKGFIFPTIGGDLIINRDIVAGSYLGTDNLIQLVDTIGASIKGGVFGGLTGVYTKTGPTAITAEGAVRQFVPVDLTANANVYLNRVYAHVKPITSVQKAMKYPFTNIMVPFIKRARGKDINALMDEFYQNLDPQMKQERNKSLYAAANDLLKEIRFHHEKEINEKFAQDLEDELVELEEKFIAIEQDYIDSIDEKDIPKLAQFSAFVSNYYKETQAVIKEDVLARGICIIKKQEVDEEGRVIGEEECVQTEDNLVITPENISKEYPSISKLLISVDELNDFHNIHLLELKGQEEEKEIENVIAAINKNLEVGESLIVTDSFGASLGVAAKGNLYQVAELRLNASGQTKVISRLHILRSSENEIQIYKDLGNIKSISIATDVRKFVPIMKFTFTGSKGWARTKFYSVPIGESVDGAPNARRADWLRALRKVFMSGSAQALDEIRKPYVVKHKVKEKSSKFGILVWRWNWLKQSDEMVVTTPEGYSKKLFRKLKGKTRGRDYESYAKDIAERLSLEIVDFAYEKITGKDSDLSSIASVSSFNRGNPGFSFKGKAKNKIVSFEGVRDEEDKIAEPYVKISRIHNGWEMDKDKALKLLRQMKEDYSFRFVEEEVLAQTEKLFLYNINLNFFFYAKAIDFMANIDEKRAQDIFIYKRRNERGTIMDREESLKISGYYTFAHNRRLYLKHKEENNLEKMSKHAMKMVESVEKNLLMSGIGQMVGGGNNIFVIGKIDGFRVGDANGDKAVLSNSFGRIGNEDLEGPVSRIRKLIGITNGEFIISWLLGRII